MVRFRRRDRAWFRVLDMDRSAAPVAEAPPGCGAGVVERPRPAPTQHLVRGRREPQLWDCARTVALVNADPDCIFCGIVAGAVSSTTIALSERAIAFMDINPVTNGHALVVPRANATDLLDITAADLAACVRVSRSVHGSVCVGEVCGCRMPNQVVCIQKRGRSGHGPRPIVSARVATHRLPTDLP